MPLDRQHALSLVRSGKEGIVDSGLVRARQINTAVPTAAHRWVFQHPDDEPIDISRLPPRERFRREVVRVTSDGDEMRVLNRIVKKPVG